MRRRHLLLPLLVAAHLAVMLLAIRPGDVAPPPSTRTIGMYDVAPAAPPELDSLPVELLPPDPAPTIDVAVHVEVPDIASPDAATVGSIGQDCGIAERVRVAIGGDAAARVSLAGAPRSVSNAIMLWDGGWVDGSPAAVRAAIVRVVAAASPECRAATERGPTLVPVAADDGTLILAIGSGTWRWADLTHIKTEQ